MRLVMVSASSTSPTGTSTSRRAIRTNGALTTIATPGTLMNATRRVCSYDLHALRSPLLWDAFSLRVGGWYLQRLRPRVFRAIRRDVLVLG